MLVLERKQGQKICLDTSDGPIEIIVTEPRAGRVKLGIVAPAKISILRDELTAGQPLTQQAPKHTSIQLQVKNVY